MNPSISFNNRSTSQRGALRHWVMGCLGLIVLVVLLVAGGFYYMFRQFAPATFDTSAKSDPPANADREILYPESAGSFKRLAFSTPDKASGDGISTGTKATYQKPGSDETINVIAMSVAEMHKFQESGNPAMAEISKVIKSSQSPNGKSGAAEGRNQAASNMGISFAIPVGPAKMQMATWSKQNWSYLVHTTGTAVLEFAKEFSPGAAEASGESTTSASTNK